ncbi:MAG TPA: polysaccharide deacetylase family protein [bacterium]|nr:polysaccharide deacetylase family protein [bacterium]
MASILTYHDLGRRVQLGLPQVSRRRFGAHLDALASVADLLVPAREAVSGSQSRAIALTFDDGYESVHTEALPEMVARGARGTVFVVVGSVGTDSNWDVRLAVRRARHLTWAQLEDLVKQGFEVASHPMSHRDLTRLAERDLAEELARSKALIEDRLATEVVSVAYPFGKADARVMDAAARLGYIYGFGNAPHGSSSSAANPMMIGRMSVYGIDGRASLLAKVGVGPGHWFEVLKCRLIAGMSHGTPLVKR